jgi:hypothetical protein
MKVLNQVEEQAPEVEESIAPDPLRPLLVGRATTSRGSPALANGVVVGELIGTTDDGRTPLVMYPGQPGSAAIVARSVVDVHGCHIGKQVVLVFEGADLARPIVMGILRDGQDSALEGRPGHVEVDSDGERMIVGAKEQLVLRCGKASITLTKAGKVLIQGAYVSNRSSGVLRLKGGSVNIN